MDDAVEVLQREFRAEETSFLLTLRTELRWDREAFTRLERAMRAACQLYATAEQLARWMAEGFHYVATWVLDWTSHPNFQRPEPDSYYADCVQRLSELAYWFFSGESPHLEGHVWPDL